MSFTNQLASDVLDHIFGTTAYTSVGDYWVALSTTTPTEAGANFTEPSGNGYSRIQTISTDWAAATVADPSVVDNSTAVTFTAATGDWASASNMTYFGIYDSSTVGNLMMFGALTTAKPVLSGDTAEFAIGDLNITLD